VSFPRLRQMISLWAPVIVWMGVIFALSAQSSLPSLPESSADAVFKKTGHAVAYAILCVLAARGLHESQPLQWRRLLAAVVVSGLYGASDELHQSLVPGRTPRIFDWLVDVAGAAAGAWAYGRARSGSRPRSGSGSATVRP
jgi:VanZ family protein